MSGGCVLPVGYEAVDIGPLFGIDYLESYYCSWTGNWHAIYVTYLLLLLSGLIWTLGHTAGNYLSPTLAKVCESLNLSYNVAGVTFLAFGNGAPDVFTQVSSFTAAVSGDGDMASAASTALIGINTMLGSSMFVVTIVVGTVAILSPCHVSSTIYLRDVGFHIFAVSTIAIVGYMGKLTVVSGIFLFCVYFSYVAVVLIVAEREARLTATMDKGAVPKRMGELEDGSAVRSLGSDLQTAFWHSTTTASTTAGAGAGAGAAGAATKKGVKSSPAPKKGGGGSGYTFLVLNDTDSDSDSDEEKGGMGLSASSSRVRGGKGEDGTIMLSGGLMGGTFEGVIEEDYVDSTLVELERTRRQAGVSYDRSSGSGRGALADGTTNAAGGKMYSTQSPLTEGLLGGGDGDEGEFDEETVQFTGSGAFTAAQPTGTSQGQPTRQGEATPLARGEEGGAGSSSSNTHLSAADDEAPNSFPPQRQAATIKEALYWQERYLQNRIRKLEASDFWALPLPQKVLTALEFPVDFVRDVTIPTLQQESWYRPYAIFHPIAIGIVYEYTFRDFEAGSVFLTVLLACVPATYIFLTTHRSKPPSQSSVLETLWVLTAFLMCIVWFYLLCGELICILESMGRIMNIPSAYLGLTLLAWGNCVGDFFSIMALAKRGLGEMAIAGCYASPIFDMLVGLGLSTTLATTKIYPEPFVLEFDRSSYVSILFLYFTLGASLLLISRRGWRLEKNFGYFLYSVYGVYTFVQISHIW